MGSNLPGLIILFAAFAHGTGPVAGKGFEGGAGFDALGWVAIVLNIYGKTVDTMIAVRFGGGSGGSGLGQGGMAFALTLVEFFAK